MKARESTQPDAVDRATEALQQLHVPDGPPEEVLAAVIAAGSADAAASQPIQFRQRRLVMLKRVAKIAAVIAIVAGTAAVAFHLIYQGPTVAFAQVREQILQARTMAWTMTVTFDNPMAELLKSPQRTMTVKSRCMFKEPGLMRQVQEHEGQTVSVVTANLRQGRCMLLMPSQKQAQVIDLGDVGNTKAFSEAHPRMNMVEELREAIAGAEEELGEKVIDGRQAVGFRVGMPAPAQHMDRVVWADAETGDILRIEFATANVAIAMSEFTFNEEYDDSLFSVEPPEGYAVTRTEMRMDNLSEQDLLDGLRFLAEHNNNVFPEQPTISPEIVKNVMKNFVQEVKQEVEQGKLSKEEAEARSKARGAELQKMIMRLLMFISTRAGDSWHYAGDGVKLGDGETPVCWYKPEGAALYRVIYGNLGVADLAEEDLPK